MNDKELLELAAKAAGVDGTFAAKWQATHGGTEKTWGITFWVPLSGGTACWNPLTDDGDALRLAVKLGLVSNFSAPYTVVELPTHPFHALEDHNNDPYAATRRAIVRAAAEIGKGME